MEDIILKHGYAKEGYGYKKIANSHAHWITTFGSPSIESTRDIQMYSYHVKDSDFDKVYDTGIVTLNESELISLINIFTKIK